jgi:hypothetical protein
VSMNGTIVQDSISVRRHGQTARDCK